MPSKPKPKPAKPAPKLLQTRVAASTYRYVEKRAKADGVSIATWMRLHFDQLRSAGELGRANAEELNRAELERVNVNLRALRAAVAKAFPGTIAAPKATQATRPASEDSTRAAASAHSG